MIITNYATTFLKLIRFWYTCAIAVAICFFIFIGVENQILIFAIIIILGLGCASIYPTLLGYGMKQTKTVSPITMAFLVCRGSIGGDLSLISSAAIGYHLPKMPFILAPYAVY